MASLIQLGRIAFERLETVFDAVFGVKNNPLYHLGALGWFFYWIVAVSGIYLYIFFDTGVTQAYHSVEYLTHQQWYAGGIMRSLHRYASDALIIVMLLHLLREYLMDRLRGPRWFTWVVGVAVLWLVYASGITGYWIVWDKLAQYIAIASTEWLDALPIFGQSIARNFLHDSTLSGRFFTLMVFIHIAVPLILLFVMWIHIQRLTSPNVNPPKALALSTLGAMVALSLVYPAVSQGPAVLNRVPSEIGLDWFYFALYPLLDIYSGTVLWWIAGIGTLVLLLAPWVPAKRNAVAVVDLENCNGCGRCVADCPFSAVSMQPRTDDKPYAQEAIVSPTICAGCGICVGACPTATPFRRRSELIAGIDLPEPSVKTLREETLRLTSSLAKTPRLMIFGCESGPDIAQFNSKSVATMKLKCIGQLPPSFMDFIISKRHADGIALLGCRTGDCHYRFGIDWTEDRMNGRRDPYLRSRVPRERILTSWVGADTPEKAKEELAQFQTRLNNL